MPTSKNIKDDVLGISKLKKWYMGIDVGVSGGVAFISESGDEQFACKIKVGEEELVQYVSHFQKSVVAARLELVHSSPQMGVKSAFTFGQSNGFLRGMLVSLKIPFETVRPIVWMDYLDCRTGGDKNITKRKAQELYPKLKVTHAVADAILIAEYCRRTELENDRD